MHANPKLMKIGTLIFILSASLCAFAQTEEQSVRQKQPVSYGFVVDNSGSLRKVLDRMVNLVRAVAEKHGEDDEAFLVTFVDSSKTVVRQEFTSEKSELHDAADNMFIEGGATALLDAVRLSVDFLAANAKAGSGRTRALLLISDGDDSSSIAKLETVTAAAKDGKIRIIVVGLSDEKLNTKLLDRLAKQTGGAAFYPRTSKDMQSMTDQIAAAIRGN